MAICDVSCSVVFFAIPIHLMMHKSSSQYIAGRVNLIVPLLVFLCFVCLFFVVSVLWFVFLTACGDQGPCMGPPTVWLLLHHPFKMVEFISALINWQFAACKSVLIDLAKAERRWTEKKHAVSFCHEHWTVQTGEIETAFLNGDKTEYQRAIYAEPPEEVKGMLGMES